MEIRLLGTGAAEGVPAIFCGCETCREAKLRGGKDIRTRAGALIDGVLKIDIPPETLHHIQRDGLDSYAWTHVLFTHSHDDHFAVKELQYVLWPFDATPKARFPICGSAAVLDAVRNNIPGVEKLELVEWRAFEPHDLGSYSVIPIRAHHKEDEECFNLIIADSSRTILYATDTGWYQEETWAFLADRALDCVIVEATDAFHKTTYWGHLDLQEAIRFRKRLLEIGGLKQDVPVVATHFSHTGRPLHAELAAALTPHGIVPGFDGMVIAV